MLEKALFIFRRDLRLEDNTGLLFALENAKEVVLAFIFTPQQIENNPYRSDRALQFMIESLEDLEEAIHKAGGKLYLFFGDPDSVVERCITEVGIDAVVVNQDYTPYSQKRDKAIEKVCKEKKVPFHSFEDLLLHPIEETVKADGKPYTVFTPFYKHALEYAKVLKPRSNRHKNYFSGRISFAESASFYKKILPKREEEMKGGRKEALKILKKIGSFSKYALTRDFPAQDATTHLSPHLKFTTVSAREVYEALVGEFGKQSPLIRSLYWRDFFTAITFHFPYVFKGSFQEKWQNIEWTGSKKLFNLWCEGKTGFPIVDAGIQELNETGFMHNRVRMITASFLVKDLHVNWQWGEKYFATKLIDYDPAVNNGNWQWVASTGCDAQPYFRIFNPWLQGAKFDPDCTYIKKWLPVLGKVPAKAIHTWYLEKNQELCPSYPEPVVDHSKESKVAVDYYKY
ncbi:MAG: deoxyribodipyrimidine photo-lyase [Verrucomicrobia bacterium]|nr:deoxyribodipyrimidine photo-lyase [Verrucomicrobiota bacterium]